VTLRVMAKKEVPMSIRRAVAAADLSSLNVAEFCRSHGVSREWFYALRRRFEAEGEAGLEPRSRGSRPVEWCSSM